MSPVSGPLRPDGLHLVKAHGTGNDFVVLLDPDDSFQLDDPTTAALCDRRRGIGADGVIRAVRADPAGPAGADGWYMDHRNADGGLPEMCGNGVRVLAHVLRAFGLVADTVRELPVDTRAGLRPVRVVADGYPVYAVEMGPATVAADPVEVVVVDADSTLRLPGVAVDVGNPHVVVDVGGSEELAAADLLRRPQLAPEPPAGANVELVAAVPGPGSAPGTGADGGHLRVRIHERGVGETLSCGTGAVAVAAAGAARSGGSQWTVDVPGGRLRVRLRRRDGEVVGSELSGPAEIVGHAVVTPQWLERARLTATTG